MTNGYCGGGCAERRAELEQHQQAQQTQQMVRPLPAVPAAGPGVGPGGVAQGGPAAVPGAPVRMARR
ncbi:MAG: hypothetical protein HOV87_24825 [Catenulispora sp.]|nr:hypothetical protein [Catenulispora sp.]